MRTLVSRFVLSLAAVLLLAAAPGAGLLRPAEAGAQLDCWSLALEVRKYCQSHELADDPYFTQVCLSHAAIVYCICAGIDCRGDESEGAEDLPADSVA
jgi:hypothetical protein